MEAQDDFILNFAGKKTPPPKKSSRQSSLIRRFDQKQSDCNDKKNKRFARDRRTNPAETFSLSSAFFRLPAELKEEVLGRSAWLPEPGETMASFTGGGEERHAGGGGGG